MVHTFPIIASLTSIFAADVVFLESDWWLNVDLAVFYVFVNFAISEYSGSDQIYYFDWSTKIASIGAYSPIFDAFVYGIIAFGWHFMLCLIT